MVTRLVENPDYVVTVSTEREEISVWNVHDAVPVRTLVGVTHPINLKAIDDTRYACDTVHFNYTAETQEGTFLPWYILTRTRSIIWCVKHNIDMLVHGMFHQEFLNS
jgi:hypothetical protein